MLEPTLVLVSELIVRSISVPETRLLRRAVLRPTETVAEVAAHEPLDAVAAGGFVAGDLVAVGLIGPEGPSGSWRVRGMATAQHHRGCGAGTRVLNALLEHARAHGATRVWCNARTPARTFYERAGFRVISEEFELPEIGAHWVMEFRTTSNEVGATRAAERARHR